MNEEKYLVLVVDRDDDIGRKTRYKTPILGRDNVIEVAQEFALVDPEDSDLNAIYAAIKLYDELTSEGKDVEIAILCGTESTDRSADEKIERELLEVLRITGAKGVYLVSDGAEDEYIIPIITSYVPIKSLRRVVIKQAPNIETTYYVIKKFIEDEKIQKKFILPLAIFFLAYGALMLLGKSSYALATSLLIISIYALIKIYKLESYLARFLFLVKERFSAGGLQVIFNTIALVILLAGTLQAIGVAITFTPDNVTPFAKYASVIAGLKALTWWLYLAYLMIFLGRIVETIVNERRLELDPLISSLTNSLVLVLVIFAILSATHVAFTTNPENAVFSAVTSNDFILYISIAIFIVVMRYIIERMTRHPAKVK
ncbi:MAG: DUF373 family protein [Euryarchaeota archaeon]|nr:DUF373 family protein [Euryarchaeota archaeon]